MDSIGELKIDSSKERSNRQYMVFFILYPARLTMTGEGTPFRLYGVFLRQHIINNVNTQTLDQLLQRNKGMLYHVFISNYIE